MFSLKFDSVQNLLFQKGNHEIQGDLYGFGPILDGDIP